MTPDSDDLERALKENLAIRRELGAEIGKADGIPPKQSGGIAYRLGWVLYWTSFLCMALWFVYLFVELASQGLPRTSGEMTLFDGIFLIAAFVVPALLMYGLGRVCRYVLSGE
jgi:hypothetical protein